MIEVIDGKITSKVGIIEGDEGIGGLNKVGVNISLSGCHALVGLLL